MKSPRRPDWRERLAASIEALRARPFGWGLADCGLTSADIVAPMIDADVAAPLRGYATRFGAIRALRRLGHRSVADYLDSFLTRTARPRAGDFVLAPSPPLDLLMVADGRGAAWGQGPDGLVRVAIPADALAWEI